MYLGNTLVFIAVLLSTLKQGDCAAWHPSEDKSNDKGGKGKGKSRSVFQFSILPLYAQVKPG